MQPLPHIQCSGLGRGSVFGPYQSFLTTMPADCLLMIICIPYATKVTWPHVVVVVLFVFEFLQDLVNRSGTDLESDL